MAHIIHSKPTLTLFTDASIRGEKAGWGGWARGDGREPVTAHGEADWHKSSDHVEMQAIFQMLLHLHRTGYLRGGDKSLLIQSDSLTGLSNLNRLLPNSWATKRPTGAEIVRAKHNPKRDRLEIADGIRMLTEHCEVVYLRHVYAHKGGGNARSWVNEKVDQLAGKATK